MEANVSLARREMTEYMLKLQEQGLLTKQLEMRMRKMGISLEGQSTHKLTQEQKIKREGRMTVSPSLLTRQRNKGAITDDEWRPESVIYHTNEFWEWINSITLGFFHEKIDYAPYEKYKAQAQYYYETAENPYDAGGAYTEMRRESAHREFRKCDNNTLYFSMKYGVVKEGSDRSGKIDYVPKEHNAVIFYLLDCGYSLLFGKPRQIFATTTMGLYIVKKLLFQENFYMKFITEDTETGMEILDDKVKVAYGYLSNWMRPQVARDYIKGFRVGKKLAKGEYALPNSRVEVLAPTKTAINGGSPQVVLVDEVGNVPDLVPMILEARPTMYVDKYQDGNLQLARQIIAWGTGVSDNKGKYAFQNLFSSTLSLWEKKEYKSALFVPLFFSWHTRCNETVYKEAQNAYFSGQIDGLESHSQEEQKQIFYMHYPSVWMDMFGMVSEKLVPKEFIDSNKDRLRYITVKERPVPGYFEPVYDYTVRREDVIGIPYKIIGANFIPYDDKDSDTSKISAYVHIRPDNKWVNRFYQGTDPINAETGNSKFASVVWDAKLNTAACVLNYRKKHAHKEAYLQSILMSLYYDPKFNGSKVGIPELIENNIGTSYKDYKELLGYMDNIVYNKELPIDLHGGGAYWGVNSKAKKKEIIITKGKDCLMTYGNNFNHNIIFNQLDTYIPKATTTGVSWQPADKRLYNDDVLDALFYSYICREVFSHLKPENMEQVSVNEMKRIIYEDIRLSDGSLSRQPKRIMA
jgi:hypothetical protein